MRICTLIFAAAVLSGIAGAKANGENTIYDSDPNHLWNRLNAALFERAAQDGKRYGLDELDILYWFSTKNLLTEPSHHRALSVLDEFIQLHGEKELREPLKRAWLQRDLWTLFDWLAEQTHEPQREELESRLAIVIRRLALTTNEIAELPDNYALTDRQQAPDLPRGLFETNGDWVNLSPDQYGNNEIAPEHDHFFGGHSAFLVMVHVPQGREAARSYLKQLRSVEHFRIDVTNNLPQEVLSTNLPEFPVNTEWALARRLVLIDAVGNLQPTHVTESIQMRRYVSISGTDFAQKFFEFQMNPRQNGALRELARDEKDFFFSPFFMRDRDPFETRPDPVTDTAAFQAPLQTCITCHVARGIYSVASFTRAFGYVRVHEPAQLYELDPNRESMAAIGWKSQQFNWGLLQGLWRQTE